MSELPLASILINNYNYGDLLPQAIDSALNQTYLNCEVIVVDDGSTDGSQSIIADYEDKIVSICKKNQGQGSAFNAGFKASRGEIIFFLDADDLFVLTKVAEIVTIFQHNHEIGWCFHRQKLINSKNQELIVNKNLSKFDSERIYDLTNIIPKGRNYNSYLPNYGLPATSALCFRKTLLTKILPMPNIKILSDNYIKELALALTPGYMTPKQLSLQTIHGKNAYTKSKNNLKVSAIIFLQTAYYIREKFPYLSSHTNNNIAMSLALREISGVVIPEYKEMLDNYLMKSTIIDKLFIYLKTIYYKTKWLNGRTR